MRTLEKEATFILESLKKLVSTAESTTVGKSISQNEIINLVARKNEPDIRTGTLQAFCRVSLIGETL